MLKLFQLNRIEIARSQGRLVLRWPLLNHPLAYTPEQRNELALQKKKMRPSPNVLLRFDLKSHAHFLVKSITFNPNSAAFWWLLMHKYLEFSFFLRDILCQMPLSQGILGCQNLNNRNYTIDRYFIGLFLFFFLSKIRQRFVKFRLFLQIRFWVTITYFLHMAFYWVEFPYLTARKLCSPGIIVAFLTFLLPGE